MATDEKPSLEELKRTLLDARLAAEKAAYAYFCECPVGPERERAHEIYLNILNATRVS
ncbi:hypothetical protein [Caballeronia zhejiangensis]|uniref:hypothetical protein n=1 Tax=Caballeronia zhejiangensis TaxID=871203 RepID=UPI000B1D696F|nr:hypothetical protein [Caballeronia zhejiangensis]